MSIDQAEIAFAAGRHEELRDALAALCPDESGRLEELVTFALHGTGPRPALGTVSDTFLASIESARRAQGRANGAGRFSTHRIIGQDLDFLGELDHPDLWSASQWLNLLTVSQMVPRKRAAVLGTMRDDGIYALEWIAHYLTLGFERVFIYTNDNADGSEHLLRRLAALDVITLIESQTSGAVRPEVKAFNHAVHLLHDLRDYEWVLFVDSDEFFVPAARYDHAIGNVLDALDRRYPDRSAGAIAYLWLWYNSAMVFDRAPGLLAERFEYATPHWLTKPLVRLNDVVSMRLQHVPELRPDRVIVDSAFEPLGTSETWETEPTKFTHEYAGGRINHYWPKSFEEFSLKKARGDALLLPDNEYARDFRLFFEWNGPDTPETRHPVDLAFVAKVKRKLAELRGLDGVTDCERQVERGFRGLLARYDQAGGLRRLYEAARSCTAPL